MIFKFLSIELLQALFLLALGMFIHILVGTGYAELKNVFNRDQMRVGISKAVIIFITIAGISLAAAVDNTLVIENTPIIEYIIMAIKGAYVFYYGQATLKVLKMISFKTDEGIEVYEKVEGE